MKNLNLIVTTFLILLASTLFAQPRIKIMPSRIIDLGDLYVGQVVEQVITIKNDGNDTLNIIDIKPVCGCTATLLKDKKQKLGPYDTVQLTINFNTKGLSGKVTKSVDIYSNDTTNSHLTILISSFVVERLKIDPPWIYFYITKIDSVYTGNVTLTNKSKDHALKILSIDTRLKNLKVSVLKQRLLPREETQLKAIFHATESDTIQGLIELTTDDTLQNKYEIKVIPYYR